MAVVTLDKGTQLGPYTVDARLGAGGMGEVYRATDTRLGRAVAIKIINGPFSERFEREARAISALNHPHICTLYDVGSSEGAAYLVMELVDGTPLRGPMPWKDVIRHIPAGAAPRGDPVIQPRRCRKCGTLFDPASRRQRRDANCA